MPHIISAHSLEPLRPWKAEQRDEPASMVDLAATLAREISGVGII